MTTSPRAPFASIWLGVAIFAALGARIFYAVARPFWFDEIFTLWLARRPPAGIVGGLKVDSGPPLFYLLSHPFVRFAEAGFDPLVRLLSLAAIAALFLAERNRRTSGGWRFVVLLAASPLLFFYSGEARAYALLGALSFLLFLATCRLRGRRSVALAAIAAGLLPWTHYLGGFVAISSIALSASKRRWRSAGVQAASILPFVLWVPVALKQPAAALAWSEEGWKAPVLGTLAEFASWARPAPYFSRFATPAPWMGALAGLGLVVLTAVVARKVRSVRDALLFAGLPLALAAAAGIARPVYFSGRTEMMVLPVALWAFARASRRSRALQALTTVGVAAGAIVILGTLVALPATPPYAVTAGFVTSAARAGDVVVASDADYLPLRREADRGALKGGLVGIPQDIERHPGWFEPGKVASPAAEVARLGLALQGIPPGGRVFFAVPPDPAARNIVMPSVRDGRPTIARPPGGDSVLVLVK